MPVILCFQVSAIVFLAVWGVVSRRVGKPQAYVYGVVLWAAAVSAVLWTLRLIVSVVPAVILLASVPLALRYPISREQFAEIAATLEAVPPGTAAPSVRPSDVEL